MGRPRLIIVVRHAQSEGNKNRDIHQTIPDHRVKLTPLGWQQAHEAGRRLRAMLKPTDTLHFFTSPYRRTRETTEGILETLTADDDDESSDSSDDPSSASSRPSPFQRDKIKVYEEPRLREQDFGNFQPCSAEMERMWQERADYGHFFYRIPNGESAADAYDRVSGFNESLWRQFGEDDFASVCVLVTHGLMSRVFLMKWYHFTVEYFEDLRNINHCEFLIMRRNDDTGKYLLENKLRTWSELRRERREAEDPNSVVTNRDADKLTRSKTFISLRRWGGCPNGCNHRREYKKRDDLETLRQKDIENVASAHGGNGLSMSGSSSTRSLNGNAASSSSQTQSIVNRRNLAKQQRSVHISEGDTVIDITTSAPQIDITKALEATDSSPDGTPSFISAEDRLRSLRSPHIHLHIGRDGGGTYSGHASLSGSDDELSADEEGRRAVEDRKLDSLDCLAERIHESSLQEKDPSRPHHHHHHGKHGAHGHAHGLSRAPGTEKARGDAAVGPALGKSHKYLDESGMGRGAKAHRLGDYSHNNSEGSVSDAGSPRATPEEGGGTPVEEAELNQLEREEKSVRGSVY